ncbi:hypothetical protein [Mycoplasma leonicaptivi]|uniref:hypothetical protein n=1 Tax=Mycoplasma leonicaptivi TaxID=36742 RepID=UPI00048260F7|nr:hypothetical protein [Mycoplasma leonicaptivi]
MKVKNDQFYTNKDVAKFCYSLIENIQQYSAIIEPSAGEGSFSDLDNKITAYDIEPKKMNIIKQDFLELDFNPKWGQKILFFRKSSFWFKVFISKKIY